jgi:hypothetical protein
LITSISFYAFPPVEAPFHFWTENCYIWIWLTRKWSINPYNVAIENTDPNFIT